MKKKTFTTSGAKSDEEAETVASDDVDGGQLFLLPSPILPNRSVLFR